ncbi:MAG: gamma-glutamylcyclotransferase [Myxococcales bacterium]|nr:gamma-glutamylcyclotransferase [Myxococcales bacterium]MCB9682019.1 gamma-glutamylcyclotransferase [Alphaproteobacteria bacterium]
MSPPSLPLFVYGTLMRSGSQAALVGDRPRQPGWIHGTLFHLPAGYPAVVPGGDDPVHGEWLPPVPDAVLRALDRYEGVPEGLYRRITLPVHTTTGVLPAWVWVMDDPRARGGVVIPSGRWRPIRQRG